MAAPTSQQVVIRDVASINANSIKGSHAPSHIEYVDISSVGTGEFTEQPKVLPFTEAPSRARRIVKAGDTILSTVRPNRRSFLFIAAPSPITVVSTGFAVLTPTPKVDPRYLYYWVTRQDFTDYLTLHAKGAAYPAVSPDDIGAAKIDLPPLPVQRRIAEILSSYDDLIENNLKRIQILDEMARSLYREWFVHFRFPGHEKLPRVASSEGTNPHGWVLGELGNICQVIPGYAFKSNDWQESGVPVIKIKNIRSDNTIETESTDFVSDDISKRTQSKFFLAHGDILLAMTGATAGKLGKLRTNQAMLLNQRVAKLVPTRPFQEFVWCSVSTEDAKQRFFLLADGAAQPNMSGEQIERVKLLYPTRELAEKFSKLVSPKLEETDNLYLKIQNLRRTRDLLLPRLLSGQIAINGKAI